MFRLFSAFLINSLLLGVVFHNAITQAADTKIKARREQAPRQGGLPGRFDAAFLTQGQLL